MILTEYDNSSVGEAEAFALRHVWAAFVDWQVWLHILVYMSIIGPCAYLRYFVFTPQYILTRGFSVWDLTLLTVSVPIFIASVKC